MFGPRDKVPGYQLRRSTVVRKDGRIERAFPEGMQMSELIRRCAATVRGIDDGVGRIVETLRRNDQLDRTLIVFTSDDGMPFGEHGFTNKIGPYDACQRVPMIVRGPSPVARGRVCRHPVGALDLIPTFFAVAGVDPPYPPHGRDLGALLRDPGAEWAHPVLIEFFGFYAGAATHRGRTIEEGRFHTNSTSPTAIPWWLFVRQGRYKYIRTLIDDEIEELYDIEADPGEHRNLAVETRYRDVLDEYRSKLDTELRRTGGESLANNLPVPFKAGR